MARTDEDQEAAQATAEQVPEAGEDDAIDAEAMADTEEDRDEEMAALADDVELPRVVKVTLPDGTERIIGNFAWELPKISGDFTLGAAGLPAKGRYIDLVVRTRVSEWDIDGEEGTYVLKLAKERITSLRVVPLPSDQLSMFDRTGEPAILDVDAILREHAAGCPDCLTSDWGGVVGEGCSVYQDLAAKYAPVEDVSEADEDEPGAASPPGVASGDAGPTQPGADGEGRAVQEGPPGPDLIPIALPGTECANPDVACGHPRLEHRKGGRCAHIAKPGHPNVYCECPGFVEPTDEPALD